MSAATKTTAKEHEQPPALLPHTTRANRAPLILVVLVPLLALWPVVSAEFIPLDDPANVSRNPDFNPPALRNLGHYWVESFHNMYAPLTYTTWAGLARLAWMDGPDAAGNQLNPYVFHAANLLVHAVNALLVYALLRKLSATPWAACAGALLFALHPLQVEPVAWVTCFRDLLSAMFSLAALLAYVTHASATPRARATRAYVAACAFLALGLLCKPTAVVVPLVAAAIDWGVLRRPLGTVARSAGGMLFVAVPFAMLAMRVQTAALTFTPPLWSRPLIVGDALAFYARKLALPLQLGLDYGRSPEWLLGQPMKWLALMAPIALAALVWVARRKKWVVAAVLLFVACLLPVLGLTKFDFQHHSAVADRYAYLAMLGPVLLLAFLLRNAARPATIAVAVLLLLLAIASHKQTRTWRDGSSIYRQTLAVNPGSLIANRGLGLLSMNRPREAEAYFRKALETKPDDPVANFHIANLYLATNRPADAVPHYRIAAAARDQAWVVTNFANALVRTGQYAEAVSVLEEALRRTPQSAELHVSLGAALVASGDRAAAADHYRDALRIKPDFALAAEELAALERGGSATAPSSAPATRTSR